MTKDDAADFSSFVLRISFVIRHSSFVISPVILPRHFFASSFFFPTAMAVAVAWVRQCEMLT